MILSIINRIARFPFRIIRGFALNLRPFYYLKKQSQKKTSGKVKVGFIVQMPELWDKEVDIYDEMKKRDNIEVQLIVVPYTDYDNPDKTLSYDGNYFIEHYSDAVKAIDVDGNVIDIQGLKFDYVFYQRPYDHYLPRELRSTELVKSSKCCYVPYGYSGSDVFNGGNTNTSFFRNMSFVFLESDYMKKVFDAKFKKNFVYRLQHVVSLGYPNLARFFDIPKNICVKKILWTPRWSYDNRVGGSHFFEYKDTILKLKEDYSDIDMVFRPHPLMFDQFISKGLMTKKSMEAFKAELKKLSIVYDYDSMIVSAIADTDLLITDYSSIIINFFLTGKPIIYCRANYDLNEEYSKIESCIYVAENQQQIESYVAMLLNGEDPLAEKRKALIEKYKLKHVGAAKRIVDYLLSDSYQ